MQTETNAATSPIVPASWGDWLRREIYLARVDWALETIALVRGTDRKQIVNSLRADIIAEATNHGLRTALDGLGDPKALAYSYAQESVWRRPRWIHGIISAGIGLTVYLAVFFSYTLGMLAVVEGNGIAESTAKFLLFDVSVYSNENTVGIAWVGGTFWALVPFIIVLTVFVISSRAWRAFPPPQARKPDPS